MMTPIQFNKTQFMGPNQPSPILLEPKCILNCVNAKNKWIKSQKLKMKRLKRLEWTMDLSLATRLPLMYAPTLHYVKLSDAMLRHVMLSYKKFYYVMLCLSSHSFGCYVM